MAEILPLSTENSLSSKESGETRSLGDGVKSCRPAADGRAVHAAITSSMIGQYKRYKDLRVIKGSGSCSECREMEERRRGWCWRIRLVGKKELTFKRLVRDVDANHDTKGRTSNSVFLVTNNIPLVQSATTPHSGCLVREFKCLSPLYLRRRIPEVFLHKSYSFNNMIKS